MLSVCLIYISDNGVLYTVKVCLIEYHNRAYSHYSEYLSKGFHHVLVVIVAVCLNEYPSLFLSYIEISQGL